MNYPVFTDTCAIARQLASETWYRIGFARSRKNLRIYETTITQNLIFNLLHYAHASGLAAEIQIQETSKEKANGYDLLLAIRQPDGQYIQLALQAKMLYHNKPRLHEGTYRAMDHWVNGTQQVDILLAYASKHYLIPIYLLYNYLQPFPFNNPVMCGSTDPSQYGCTIADPNQINQRFIQHDNVPSFNDLHPTPAIPWCMLFCKHSDTAAVLTQNLGCNPDQVTASKISADKLHDTNEWNNISPLPVIDRDILQENASGFVPFEDESKLFLTRDYQDVPDQFAPMFRIIFGIKPS